MKNHLSIFLLCSLFWACQPKEKTESVSADKSIVETLPEAPSVESYIPAEEQSEERTEWQNPNYVIESLGDLTGKTVVDLGAGSGYFTFKLAQKAERVIAMDIEPRALEYIENQKSILGSWAQVIETRLTPPDVPNVLSDEADMILVVNTFNYIPEKAAYFARLNAGLKQGGSIVIVDFKKEDIPLGPSNEYKSDAKEVRKLLRQSGFRKLEIDEKGLEYQFIVKGEKR